MYPLTPSLSGFLCLSPAPALGKAQSNLFLPPQTSPLNSWGLFSSLLRMPSQTHLCFLHRFPWISSVFTILPTALALNRWTILMPHGAKHGFLSQAIGLRRKFHHKLKQAKRKEKKKLPGRFGNRLRAASLLQTLCHPHNPQHFPM